MMVLKDLLTGRCEISGGKLFVEGRPVPEKNFGMESVVCIDNGAGFCKSLTVEENLQSILGKISGGKRAFRRRLEEQMAWIGLRCKADTLVSQLSGLDQCLLWLVLARLQESSLVLFDCTESSYSEQDLERYRPSLEKIREAGCSVLVFSRLPNLLIRMSDRAALLRNGSVRKVFYREEIEEQAVLSYLMGLEAVQRDQAAGRMAAPELEINRGGTLPVQQGEILGICDASWSLEEPMPDYIEGLLRENGWSWPMDLGPHDLVYISENSEESLLHSLSIGANIALVASRLVKPRFGVLPERMKQFYLQEFKTRFELEEEVTEVEELRLFERKLLSIYRWALTRPQVLLLENPLLRIPLAERATLTEYFRSLAEDGFCLVISANALENLKGICDRVLLARDKKVSQVLCGEVLNGVRKKEDTGR